MLVQKLAKELSPFFNTNIWLEVLQCSASMVASIFT